MDKENGKEKHILTKPDGELVIRTIAMPRDTNPTGDIFGGWLLSQMDIGGLIAATEIAKGRTTTVAINAMRFWNPVHVGDIICIHAALKRVGRTSITFLINAWAVEQYSKKEKHLVTEAEYTYVSIDSDGRPTEINKS
ncbi:MAG TPA: acyl-CoA thioesterase [Victivallales bacterium]|nr:acyl-CoA thioesterase [Victivallales bacterium]